MGRKKKFFQPDLRSLCKLGKHAPAFSQGQPDPGHPMQPYLTVTDEAVCQEGESQRGKAATPRRNSDSLASACCQSELAISGPGAGCVSTHFHTWTNSLTGQEKQPTHPYLPLCLPSASLPSKNTQSGGPVSCCLTSYPFPSLSSLSSFLAHYLSSSAGWLHVFLVPLHWLSQGNLLYDG